MIGSVQHYRKGPKSEEVFIQHYRCKVGKGSQVSFWKNAFHSNCFPTTNIAKDLKKATMCEKKEQFVILIRET